MRKQAGKKRCQVLVYTGLGEERRCGKVATHYSIHPSVGYCCQEHARHVTDAKPIKQPGEGAG